MKVGAYYDDFAARYEHERHQGYHALIDDLETSIVLHEATGDRVLEVGCGTGLILERLARDVPRLVGMDLSREMLGVARCRGLTVVQGDVLDIPFSDSTFDLVCSFKVLAHVPDIRKGLREIARVTRPGGTAVLEFYNPLSLRYLVKRVAGPRRTGENVTEADVTTRWDPPWRIASYLPPDLELIRLRGVRVVTPAAAMLKVPVLGNVLSALESVLSHTRVAAGIGGFVVAVCRRR